MSQTDGSQRTTDIDIIKSETAIDDEVIQKMLIFSKMLFNHGVNHSNKNTYLDRFLAIHHFDNAIELFLRTIVIKYDIRFKEEPSFKKLWGEINKELEKKISNYNLPLVSQITNLHNARNLSQHEGDAISFENIIKYQGYAKDFLSKCSEDIFKINFNKVYVSSFIDDTKIKDALIESEKYIEENNFKQAIESSAKAFYYLKYNEHDDLFWDKLRRFMFLGGGVIAEKRWNSSIHSSDKLERQIDDKINKFAEQLNNRLNERARKINEFAKVMEEEFAIIKLGVDYKEYKHFNKISPDVLSSALDGPIRFVGIDELNYNEENARFCLEFVLEAALKLQSINAKDTAENK